MSNAGPIWTRGRGVIVCSLLVLSLVVVSAAYAGRDGSKRHASTHAKARHSKLVEHQVWHQRKRVDHGVRPCPPATVATTAAARRTAPRARRASAKIKVKRSKGATLRTDGVARKAVCRSAPAGSPPAPPTDTGAPPPSDSGPPLQSDAGPPPPTESADTPAPIAGQGYKEVFADEFDSLDRKVWDDHIWYDETPHADWAPFQTVTDGVLHLQTSKSYTYTHTVCDDTTTPPTCADQVGDYPGDTITTMSSGKTFTRGYFEARMKWSGGNGSWPGFWLYSERHANNDPNWPNLNPVCASNSLPLPECYSGELDVFEGQGSEPNVFYGTQHRNSCNCYGVADDQNDPNSVDTGIDLTAGFHTYAVEWTASQITWYLDGQPTRITPVAPYDSLNQPMFLLLQMWSGGWTADPDNTTPETIETQVDWVRVWQKSR
jgi:beta-glucanase (GH16 family)